MHVYSSSPDGAVQRLKSAAFDCILFSKYAKILITWPKEPYTRRGCPFSKCCPPHWKSLLRCTQKGWTDRDAVGKITYRGPKEPFIRYGGGGKDRTNPFAAARGIQDGWWNFPYFRQNSLTTCFKLRPSAVFGLYFKNKNNLTIISFWFLVGFCGVSARYS